MATITGAADERIFQITRWLGLHESPDGDTKLKFGEAAKMRNFRITRDGNLQKRPGLFSLCTVSENNPIMGLWGGIVGDNKRLVIACNGGLYYYNIFNGTLVNIGSLNTDNDVFMFGFGGKLYILNGLKYYEWGGSANTFKEVEGYVPCILTETSPATGAGNTAEQINKLTAKRRVWYSPDGETTAYQLPEYPVTSVDAIRLTATGSVLPPAAYTVDTNTGVITFNIAPTAGVNKIEVEYTFTSSYRSQVEAMRYAEIYNGAQDSRVFLYGDGSNKAFYSGLDGSGRQSADYFPDMNEIAVGDENTPITGMIRHFSQLAVFKSDSAWQIAATTTTLATSEVISAYYVTPVNKAIGNAAPGQVQLVLNSPYTLFGNDLYEWKNSSYYTSNLTRDERQAKRISDRIYSTLQSFDTPYCKCFDHNDAQEYYICCDKKALVYNYAADAWYYYTNFDASCMCSFAGELVIGTSTGHICLLNGRTDMGTAIAAYWESGSTDFGKNFQRKYSAMLWLGIKPQEKSSVTVTVQTDKSVEYTQKLLASTFFGFTAMNFADMKFTVNQRPQIERVKIKAKKFVYYKLILKDSTETGTVTVLAADMRVRFTGYAK